MEMNDARKDASLGRVLHEARDKMKEKHPEGFSIRQFSKAIGLSPAFLSKLENGSIDPPSPEKLILIAQKLALDPNYVLLLANKIDPELKRIVISHQVEIAEFLRIIDGLSSQHIHFLIQQAKMYKDAERTENVEKSGESSESKGGGNG
jgi:transcriptional regulator with XRE-family HTH domain